MCVCVAESLCVVTQWRETRESYHHRDSGPGSKRQQTRLHPEPVHWHCLWVLSPRYMHVWHTTLRVWQKVSPSAIMGSIDKTNQDNCDWFEETQTIQGIFPPYQNDNSALPLSSTEFYSFRAFQLWVLQLTTVLQAHQAAAFSGKALISDWELYLPSTK